MSQEDGQPGPEPQAATPKEPQAKPSGDSGGFDQLPDETKAEIKRLRAEAASNRREAQEAKAKVQEYEQAGASEVEKLSAKVAKAEQERDEAKTSLLRYQVGAEKGLDPELMPFLTGSTKEELEEKADVLLSKVGKPEPKSEFDGGAREPAPEPKTPEDAHSEFVTALLTGRST